MRKHLRSVSLTANIYLRYRRCQLSSTPSIYPALICGIGWCQHHYRQCLPMFRYSFSEPVLTFVNGPAIAGANFFVVSVTIAMTVQSFILAASTFVRSGVNFLLAVVEYRYSRCCEKRVNGHFWLLYSTASRNSAFLLSTAWDSCGTAMARWGQT